MVIIQSHSLHWIFWIPALALVTRSLIKHQPIHPASATGPRVHCSLPSPDSYFVYLFTLTRIFFFQNNESHPEFHPTGIPLRTLSRPIWFQAYLLPHWRIQRGKKPHEKTIASVRTWLMKLINSNLASSQSVRFGLSRWRWVGPDWNRCKANTLLSAASFRTLIIRTIIISSH